MKPFTAMLIILVLLSPIWMEEMGAKRIRQTHRIETTAKRIPSTRKKAVRVGAGTEYMAFGKDSTEVILRTDSIRFAGYDKPVNASRESFHIINRLPVDISKAGIRITYLDLQGRMLHAREDSVNCLVPSGETRLTSVISWDFQHTFYYYRSGEPRKTATPYKVKIELLWVDL